MYLMPLNCSLTVVTIVNFMLYAFYHNNRKQVGPEPWSHIPLPPTLYLHNLQMLAEQPWGNTRGQGPYPGAQDLKEAPQPLHHPHTNTHTHTHTQGTFLCSLPILGGQTKRQSRKDTRACAQWLFNSNLGPSFLLCLSGPGKSRLCF